MPSGPLKVLKKRRFQPLNAQNIPSGVHIFHPHFANIHNYAGHYAYIPAARQTQESVLHRCCRAVLQTGDPPLIVLSNEIEL